MRIRMVLDYTVFWEHTADPEYNTLNLHIHFLGARSAAPDEAAEDREGPGLEICEGAPHSGVNSLYCALIENSNKTTLFLQEHVEEITSLKWSHLSNGGAAASLRKQLQAKDTELREVQRRMAQWKEETAARLAFKFEEELTAELERYLFPKDQCHITRLGDFP